MTWYVWLSIAIITNAISSSTTNKTCEVVALSGWRITPCPLNNPMSGNPMVAGSWSWSRTKSRASWLAAIFRFDISSTGNWITLPPYTVNVRLTVAFLAGLVYALTPSCMVILRCLKNRCTAPLPHQLKSVRQNPYMLP